MVKLTAAIIALATLQLSAAQSTVSLVFFDIDYQSLVGSFIASVSAYHPV